MVVKDRVGRRRYILAMLPRTGGDEALANALEAARGASPRLKVIDRSSDLVLVRCDHRTVAEVRRLLNEMGLETIVTSGTISGAERRAGEHGVRFRARRRESGGSLR
ncbi:MAG: hypothetical protein L0Z54_05020 [Thermoplasmata archaeon]|nr:hypothetical protein [Thermoplasmata archaeon]